MENKEFPEQKPKAGLTPENPVDFSDLGPLFSADPLEETTEKEQVLFDPQPSEDTEAPEQAQQILFNPDENTDEEEQIIFDPDTEPAQATESPVDFSDLGPLFTQDSSEASQDNSPAPEELQEAGEVLPGAAAMLLKKLRELPQEEPAVPEQPAEEIYDDQDAPDAAEEASELPSESPEEEYAGDALTVEQPPETAEEIPLEEENPQQTEPAENPPVPAELGEEGLDQASQALAEALDTSENAPEAEPVKKHIARKGRPKRKKGEGFFGIPNILVTAVWIAITVLIGVTLGRMAWVCAADVLAFGKEDKLVTITIYEADTIDDIARKLHDSGLIRYPGLFKLYASLAVDEGEIHPGIWDLNTRYDYHAMVNMMSPSSSREVVELMIPEGYSCRQIFELMEENKICTSLDLASYAAAGELDEYWFLEGVPRGDMYCLEGFLFPDTYQFYKNDSPRAVLTKMLDNFEAKFDDEMYGQIDTLNARLSELMTDGGHGADFIAQHQFTVRDVVNVASLIEKETSSADEGYTIASVIYNRLFNWGKNVPYLNIDATIVYALGGKTKLTPEDLKVDSPYNTYTHTGLTPGPIANPGLASIKAALDPSDSDYYFYVLDPALGSHRFSTTYEEHKANIASIGG